MTSGSKTNCSTTSLASPAGASSDPARVESQNDRCVLSTRVPPLAQRLCAIRRRLCPGVEVEDDADPDNAPPRDVNRPRRRIDEDVHERRPRRYDKPQQRHDPAVEGAVDVIRERPEQKDRKARREKGNERKQTSHRPNPLTATNVFPSPASDERGHRASGAYRRGR